MITAQRFDFDQLFQIIIVRVVDIGRLDPGELFGRREHSSKAADAAADGKITC